MRDGTCSYHSVAVFFAVQLCILKFYKTKSTHGVLSDQVVNVKPRANEMFFFFMLVYLDTFETVLILSCAQRLSTCVTLYLSVFLSVADFVSQYSVFLSLGISCISLSVPTMLPCILQELWPSGAQWNSCRHVF